MLTQVLIVSLGATGGLRTADAELAGSLRRAGVKTEVAQVPLPPIPPERLWLPGRYDLMLARAARRSAGEAVARHRPKAVVYSSTVSTFLWPSPGAVRFDVAAPFNRPGPSGLWERALERWRLARSPLLLPWSEQGLRTSPVSGPAVVVPVPVEPSEGPAVERDVAAVTYANLPVKKGLDRVLAAWRAVRAPGERLLVAGTDERVSEPGVEVVGRLPGPQFRALLRRARSFVIAPRREDYGLVQLEALADGCALVTTPAPGPYVALEPARRLDPRLVSEDLGPAIRDALDAPAHGYAERALSELRPWRREAVDRVVAEQLVPRLLGA